MVSDKLGKPGTLSLSYPCPDMCIVSRSFDLVAMPKSDDLAELRFLNRLNKKIKYHEN